MKIGSGTKKILIILIPMAVLGLWGGLHVLSNHNTEYDSVAPKFHVTYPEGWFENTRDRNDGPVIRLFGINSSPGKRGFYVNKLKEPSAENPPLAPDPAFDALNPFVAATFTDLLSNESQIQIIRTGPSTFAGQAVVEIVHKFEAEDETVGFVRVFAPLRSSGYEWLQFGQISLISLEDLSGPSFQAIEENWNW